MDARWQKPSGEVPANRVQEAKVKKWGRAILGF